MLEIDFIRTNRTNLLCSLPLFQYRIRLNTCSLCLLRPVRRRLLPSLTLRIGQPLRFRSLLSFPPPLSLPPLRFGASITIRATLRYLPPSMRISKVMEALQRRFRLRYPPSRLQFRLQGLPPRNPRRLDPLIQRHLRPSSYLYLARLLGPLPTAPSPIGHKGRGEMPCEGCVATFVEGGQAEGPADVGNATGREATRLVGVDLLQLLVQVHGDGVVLGAFHVY